MHADLDPLAKHYLTDEPGIGGVIKVRPEDFIVDEIPLYDPAGEGEHLYLGIEKRGVSHGELLGVLKRTFNVGRHAIGFAGMKDKAAVTRQTVSIHLPHDPQTIDLGHERLRVLWATRHRNKIKRGHLRGNRFSVRIREVDPLKVVQVRKQLERLSTIGVPAYFGQQRFGYRRNSHLLGAMLLEGRSDAILDELLGSNGSPFPEYQVNRRRLYDEGRLEQAYAQWATADHAERRTLEALLASRSARKAVSAIGKTHLDFWVHAMQSAVFNRVLDARLKANQLHELFEGDLAWKHDSRAVFRVTAEELRNDALGERLNDIEISPSGPLWGWKMMRAEGQPGEVEWSMFKQFRWNVDRILDPQIGPEGSRRPMRVPVTSAEVDAGTDDNGPYIRLLFDLPRGAYATIVLREIMKTDEDALRGVRPGEQPMVSSEDV